MLGRKPTFGLFPTQRTVELFYATEEELHTDVMFFVVRLKFDEERLEKALRKRQKSDKKYACACAP